MHLTPTPNTSHAAYSATWDAFGTTSHEHAADQARGVVRTRGVLRSMVMGTRRAG